MDDTSFGIGVNYWPARGGLGFLRRFDRVEVEEDLDRMVEWGISSIRVLPLWEDLQPERERVNTKALGRLDTLAGMCAQRSLGLWVTLFAGHVHGVNWLPSWMVEWSLAATKVASMVKRSRVRGVGRDPFEDDEVLRAQKRLVRELLVALDQHPALAALDLGERVSSVFPVRDEDRLRRWSTELVEEIRLKDPRTPVTIGLQLADLLQPGSQLIRVLAPQVSFFSLSLQPGEASFGRGPDDPLLGLFGVELVRMLSEGKECRIAALGAPTTRDRVPATPRTLREGVAESFARKSLECLRRHGAREALWWHYADVRPSQWRAFPYDRCVEERSLGLVSDDWRVKPTVLGIRAVERTRVAKFPDPHWWNLEPEQYWRNPGHHIQNLYDRFCDEIPLPP